MKLGEEGGLGFGEVSFASRVFDQGTELRVWKTPGSVVLTTALVMSTSVSRPDIAWMWEVVKPQLK